MPKHDSITAIQHQEAIRQKKRLGASAHAHTHTQTHIAKITGGGGVAKTIMQTPPAPPASGGGGRTGTGGITCFNGRQCPQCIYSANK